MKVKLPKLTKLYRFFHNPGLILKISGVYTKKLSGRISSGVKIIRKRSRQGLKPFNNAGTFLSGHRDTVRVSVFLMAFAAGMMTVRGYYVAGMKSNVKKNGAELSYTFTPKPLTLDPLIPVPTELTPTPAENTSDVLGTSDYSAPVYTAPIYSDTPFPTLPPLPTLVPMPTNSPTSAPSTSSSGNRTGNSNCTTGPGVPNAWYSDVYPNPPITTNTGSVQMLVTLRDCNVQTAPVSDSLTITLTSNDPTAKINGSSSPVTVQAQNGQASFSVSSQNSVTDTFTVSDSTNSFTITDINNHNPSVTFTAPSSGSSGSSGNPNCTTGPGVPNAWYSDVYPASPVSANTGASVTFTVILRDCNKDTVSAGDTLTFSQTSNDAGLTVNGSAPPVSLKTQNGQATFNVSSTNGGTDTFNVSDTTNSFTVTDPNNHNPSVVFTSPAANTPTQAPSGPTSTPNPTSVPVNPTSPPAATQTPIPVSTVTPTTHPVATATSAPAPSNTPKPQPTGS